MNSKRRDACRYFRNRGVGYLKIKINELATKRTRTLETYVEE
jgi:hypothetical protein